MAFFYYNILVWWLLLVTGVQMERLDLSHLLRTHRAAEVLCYPYGIWSLLRGLQ